MKRNTQKKKLMVNKITISKLDYTDMIAARGGSNCPPPTIGGYLGCPSDPNCPPDTSDVTTTVM